MNKNKIFVIAGSIISLAAMSLAWYWFGWKLVVVLMLFGWGSNLERFKNETSS